MLGVGRGTLLIPAAALVAAGAALAAPLDPFEVWGRFVATSSAIVSPQTIDAVEIDRAAEPPIGSPEVWLLARTKVTVTEAGRRTEKLWADSRTCPQVIESLAKLADVERVAIQPPGRPWPTGRIDRETAERLRRSGGGYRESTIFDAGTYEIDAQEHTS